MEVIERHSGNYASCTILDYEYGSLNFSNVLFVSGGVHNENFHQLIYIIVKLHVHEGNFNYNDTSRIDFHNQF